MKEESPSTGSDMESDAFSAQYSRGRSLHNSAVDEIRETIVRRSGNKPSVVTIQDVCVIPQEPSTRQSSTASDAHKGDPQSVPQQTPQTGAVTKSELKRKAGIEDVSSSTVPVKTSNDETPTSHQTKKLRQEMMEEMDVDTGNDIGYEGDQSEGSAVKANPQGHASHTDFDRTSSPTPTSAAATAGNLASASLQIHPAQQFTQFVPRQQQQGMPAQQPADLTRHSQQPFVAPPFRRVPFQASAQPATAVPPYQLRTLGEEKQYLLQQYQQQCQLINQHQPQQFRPVPPQQQLQPIFPQPILPPPVSLPTQYLRQQQQQPPPPPPQNTIWTVIPPPHIPNPANVQPYFEGRVVFPMYIPSAGPTESGNQYIDPRLIQQQQQSQPWTIFEHPSLVATGVVAYDLATNKKMTIPLRDPNVKMEMDRVVEASWAQRVNANANANTDVNSTANTRANVNTNTNATTSVNVNGRTNVKTNPNPNVDTNAIARRALSGRVGTGARRRYAMTPDITPTDPVGPPTLSDPMSAWMPVAPTTAPTGPPAPGSFVMTPTGATLTAVPIVPASVGPATGTDTDTGTGTGPGPDPNTGPGTSTGQDTTVNMVAQAVAIEQARQQRIASAMAQAAAIARYAPTARGGVPGPKSRKR